MAMVTSTKRCDIGGVHDVVKEAVELFESELKGEFPLKDFSKIEDESKIREVGQLKRGEIIRKFTKEMDGMKSIRIDLNEMVSQIEEKIDELVWRNESFRTQLTVFLENRAKLISSGFKALAQSKKNEGITSNDLRVTLETLKQAEITPFAQYLSSLIPGKEQIQLEEKEKLKSMLDRIQEEVMAVEVVDADDAITGQVDTGAAAGPLSRSDLKDNSQSNETLGVGQQNGVNGDEDHDSSVHVEDKNVGGENIHGEKMDLEGMLVLAPIPDDDVLTRRPILTRSNTSRIWVHIATRKCYLVSDGDNGFTSNDDQLLPLALTTTTNLPNPGSSGLQRIAAVKCKEKLAESVNEYCEPGENELYNDGTWYNVRNGNVEEPVRKKQKPEDNTEELLKCPFCDKTYTSGNGIGTHLSKKHKEHLI